MHRTLFETFQESSDFFAMLFNVQSFFFIHVKLFFSSLYYSHHFISFGSVGIFNPKFKLSIFIRCYTPTGRFGFLSVHILFSHSFQQFHCFCIIYKIYNEICASKPIKLIIKKKLYIVLLPNSQIEKKSKMSANSA